MQKAISIISLLVLISHATVYFNPTFEGSNSPPDVDLPNSYLESYPNPGDSPNSNSDKN